MVTSLMSKYVDVDSWFGHRKCIYIDFNVMDTFQMPLFSISLQWRSKIRNEETLALYCRSLCLKKFILYLLQDGRVKQTFLVSSVKRQRCFSHIS